MAMQIGRNIGYYANRFSLPAKVLSGERLYMGARRYSSASQSQIQVPQQPALIRVLKIAANISGSVFFVWFVYCFGTIGYRRLYAEWKAEKNVQAMLEKLESKKRVSAEAYLVELDREVNALKADLFNRPADVSKMSLPKRQADMMQLKIKIREVDALRESVFSRYVQSSFRILTGLTKRAIGQGRPEISS